LFQRAVHLFNHREFFECHEALEEVWLPEQGVYPQIRTSSASIHG
jgi:predicted metal-dependent hydrolase